ncbi:MAG: cytochrome c maturation protein CcmE, partial [candidate division NC10 bacterium]
QALVYFYTPSELQAQAAVRGSQRIRLGGMVVEGSLVHKPETLSYAFQLTDGGTKVPVRFTGIPPDLFKEGTGAIVEGQMGADGVFAADLIMAKHNEEYRPPSGDQPSPQELYRSPPLGISPPRRNCTDPSSRRRSKGVQSSESGVHSR